MNSTVSMFFMIASSFFGENLNKLVIHELVFAEQLECIQPPSGYGRSKHIARQYRRQRINKSYKEILCAEYRLTIARPDDINARSKPPLASCKPCCQNQFELVRKRGPVALLFVEMLCSVIARHVAARCDHRRQTRI